MEKKQGIGTPLYILSCVAFILFVLVLTIIYFSFLKPQDPILTVHGVFITITEPQQNNNLIPTVSTKPATNRNINHTQAAAGTANVANRTLIMSSDSAGSATNSRRRQLGLNMTVHNPNRASFYYTDVAAALLNEQGNRQLGPVVMVPGGRIGPQCTLKLAVFLTLDGEGANLPNGNGYYYGYNNNNNNNYYGHTYYNNKDVVTLNSLVAISGDVSILGSFSRHVAAKARCTSSISLDPADVVGYSCVSTSPS